MWLISRSYSVNGSRAHEGPRTWSSSSLAQTSKARCEVRRQTQHRLLACGPLLMQNWNHLSANRVNRTHHLDVWKRRHIDLKRNPRQAPQCLTVAQDFVDDFVG